MTASGKTTLMMQLAAGVNFKGHKLVCKDPTLSKAEFISRRLEGSPALIFIDDFANDIEAFQHLLTCKNIILVGFERDYNYEMASHKIDQSKCLLLDITSLEPKDIQDVFTNIPVEIRTEHLEIPSEEEATPSLFEIIQMNTAMPKLKDRFASVITQLENADTTLADILVMFSYVHSCRTPVSFDMLLAFVRNVTENYDEVYKLIQKLGTMVLDYVGTTIEIDTQQDYFVPRSTLISEAIMAQVPSKILKRVLLTFHNEVSPYRVFRYDIFKKKAYDANIMSKAFTNIEEGKDFYEKAYQADKSPYLRQQGALYLLKKRQYRDAFVWIDEALIRTKYKVFSIRNSHAIILFRANIDKDVSDLTVRETIDQSMKILSECYHADQRKLYHALTFADQAIRYHDKFGGDKAKQYLITAKEWLTEEKKRIPSSQSLKYLLSKVSKQLAIFY